MKGFKLYVFVLTLIFIISCKSDEISVFPSLEDRVKNDGYFPLAPNNSWIYENRTATVENGNYTYDEGYIELEPSITSTNQIEKNGGSRFDYVFSPINLGKTIGGFIGAFSRISKNDNGEYNREQIVSITDVYNNGDTFTGYQLKLNDQKFLIDDPKVGQIISTNSEKFTSPDGAIEIEYTITSTVVDILDKLPSNLTNSPGIDDHLKKYSNILHTRDVVFIKNIKVNESGGNRLQLKAKVKIDDSAYAELINVDTKAKVWGWLHILGISFLPVYATGNNVRVFELTQRADMCPSTGIIDVNTVLKGGSIDLITNQAMMETNQYWAKGVGNIKSITSFKDLKATLNLEDYLSTDPYSITITPDDPNCKNEVNHMALKLHLEATISGLEIDVPLKFSENSTIIQNLRSYIQRKTL